MIAKFVLLVLTLACGAAAAQGPAVPAAGWPRHLVVGDGAVLVYSPQVLTWSGNAIAFRAAAAVKRAGPRDETFGTIEGTATTRVDKTTRTVGFADLALTKVDFPALPDRGAALRAPLAKALTSTIGAVSLDRLQASLAATTVTPRPVAVSNAPPRVIVSMAPAILIPIDGAPVWKPVAGSAGFTRIVNTRALILKSPAAPQVFLRVYDGWLMADSLDGPWTQPFLPPNGIDAVAKQVAATRTVDLLSGGRKANPKPSLAQGVPVIYTSEVPAELVVFKGSPDFAPIVGTALSWATNTTSDVLRDASSTYLLLAGRWFRAPSMSGPWTFVASDALPADFARIPPTSLAGAVLPAVAGTPQAREAVAENAIAQTATVPRTGGPAFTPTFDGAPRFVAEPNTSIARAVNASVPVLRADNAYYAVKAGIWFTAAQVGGPWSVATSVPAAIYAIPPTSPVHFVTFVRIYGATPDVVYEGYTPGYLGAVIGTGGTVVYGTGYAYPSWIGDAWYPAPATYGLAAAPVFNPRVGYTYGFATGLATAAWSAPYFGGARFDPGYWGHYPCCGSASANVYRAWFKPPKAKVAKPAAPAKVAPAVAVNAPPPVFNAAAASAFANSGPQVPIRHMGPERGYDMSMVSSADGANAGPVPNVPTYISANAYYASLAKNGGWNPDSARNETYAGDDGKVYRQHQDGWQQHAPTGWTAAPAPPPTVVAEAQARANVDPGMVAGSYSMSNTTRFTGQQGDGWSRRDAGDGGYSRTLGGDGGISAEYNNYRDQVLNNEFDIAANGGWWSDSVYLGGAGWSGRLGAD
ncbi:MAG: hypothetical protein IT518_07715 [Burkholderiales bacterium]|nr:hypothetical protein [Burkholderiales bacterium]